MRDGVTSRDEIPPPPSHRFNLFDDYRLTTSSATTLKDDTTDTRGLSGEEGRGKSRANMMMMRGTTSTDKSTRRPTTPPPPPAPMRNVDVDTTPRANRPLLHTPPQMFPSSTSSTSTSNFHFRTSSSSSSSTSLNNQNNTTKANRLLSPTTSSYHKAPTIRPTSSQSSHSSTTSRGGSERYSEEEDDDNAWARELTRESPTKEFYIARSSQEEYGGSKVGSLAPPVGGSIATPYNESTKSLDTTSLSGGGSQVESSAEGGGGEGQVLLRMTATTTASSPPRRPLSEFDVMAAYARSDTDSLPPNSPSLVSNPIPPPSTTTTDQDQDQHTSSSRLRRLSASAIGGEIGARNDQGVDAEGKGEREMETKKGGNGKESGMSTDRKEEQEASSSELATEKNVSTSTSANLLQPTFNITPTSSRAPSPTPSLTPSSSNILPRSPRLQKQRDATDSLSVASPGTPNTNRPSSRSSNYSNRSVSSPVRPPRRQVSNVNLNNKNATATSTMLPLPIPTSSNLDIFPSSSKIKQSSDSNFPTSSATLTLTSTSIQPPLSSASLSTSPNLISTSTASPPSSSSPAALERGTGTQRSPKPPSIPEKSRRRASTLGLGLSNGGSRHGRSARGSIDHGNEGGEVLSTLSGPSTPLSASDFAEVYSRLDWGDSTTNSPLNLNLLGTPSSSTAQQQHDYLSTNNVSTNNDQNDGDNRSITSSITSSPRQRKQTRSSAHVRERASPGLSSPEFQLVGPGSVGMDARSISRDSRSSESSLKGGGRVDDNDRDETRAATPTLTKDPMDVGGGDTKSASTRVGGGGGGGSKGDAKARAQAFIADLKRARQEASGSLEGEAPTTGEEMERIGNDEGKKNTMMTAGGGGDSRRSSESRRSFVPSSSLIQQPGLSESSLRSQTTNTTALSSPQIRSAANIRSPSRSTSTSSFVWSQSTTAPIPPPSATRSPLLRRRPLPLSIQATGELRKARTAGERARIYAVKINELSREVSRLTEWIEEVRAGGRAAVVHQYPSDSPLKQARSFRQDASTATFAPRGDGYRAKEIHSLSFGPKDLIPQAPFPGVLIYNSLATNSSTPDASSSRSTLGSGLPAPSTGSGRTGFFSRSLGRRASKREPSPTSSSASHSNHQHHHHHPRSAASLPISNPSPLLYSTASPPSIGGPTIPAGPSAIVAAGRTSMTISGPRMPGATPSRGSTLESRTSAVSSPTPISPPPSSANPHRSSFSYPSNTNYSLTHPSIPEPSPSSSSVSSSPFFYPSSATPTPTHNITQYPDDLSSNNRSELINSESLSRLSDILPQANEQDLVNALKKSGGDDVLAISVYLSEEASKKKK